VFALRQASFLHLARPLRVFGSSDRGATQKLWVVAHRHSKVFQYAGAALAVWVALSLWSLSPLLHRHPVTLFLAVVLLTARYLGFGPALLCSLLSTACLDVFVFVPRFSAALSAADLERLLVFLAISVFAGSMTRQRTLAELRAEQSTREMAAIVECSEDAIFSKSPQGTITSWNPGAERLYGYSAEEAVGMPVHRLVPPERCGEIDHILDVMNRGGHIEPYQTDRARKDGTCVPVLLSVSPLRNRKGEIVGASTITRDLSAQKQSEEAVRRSEKLATAGRLAASIAHEINNPLEAVVNLLYLARHDSGNAQQYLHMAEQEVGRIARLAQQTLGFVRESNSPGWMDPAVIMDEMLQLYSRKLQGKNIHVIQRYRNSTQINGYSGEVRQLLANLLVNAVDAMAEGGTLQVRVATSRHWSDRRDGVRITVADNGSGIPQENLDHVFEPFFTTKKDTGTGLGLWVSRGIVQKHGGSLRVRSRTTGPSTGTVFSIFLPSRLGISRVA
jgi:PAS domain S-box-containing protein